MNEYKEHFGIKKKKKSQSLRHYSTYPSRIPTLPDIHSNSSSACSTSRKEEEKDTIKIPSSSPNTNNINNKKMLPKKKEENKRVSLLARERRIRLEEERVKEIKRHEMERQKRILKKRIEEEKRERQIFWFKTLAVITNYNTFYGFVNTKFNSRQLMKAVNSLSQWFSKLIRKKRYAQYKADKHYFWPRIVVTKFFLRYVRKRICANVIYDFLHSQDPSNFLVSYVKEYMKKVAIINRAMRRHLMLNKSRVEIINMYFETLETDYVNQMQQEKHEELEFIKPRNTSSSLYLEEDPQLGENFKSIRDLERQLADVHNKIIKNFRKRGLIEKSISTLKVRDEIKYPMFWQFLYSMSKLHESRAKAKYFSDMMIYRSKSRHEIPQWTGLYDNPKFLEKKERLRMPRYEKFHIWRYCNEIEIKKMVIKGIDLEKEKRLKESAKMSKTIKKSINSKKRY